MVGYSVRLICMSVGGYGLKGKVEISREIQRNKLMEQSLTVGF